ncbi:uncharacterized protein BX663DRAFT_517928, partial [Cokeromyces recurvatus]|uniref:uncharacterized protein n=1 Tax=Cokeromyces recurvatus TaxID=90255 RepID=UPI0022209121
MMLKDRKHKPVPKLFVQDVSFQVIALHGSPECSFYILSKAKTLALSLGYNYTAYTRKLPFDI